jgi:hypothetical protein
MTAHEDRLTEWYERRWPASAEKVECFSGAMHWQGGPWDDRDVQTAQRTYPGWRAELGFEGHALAVYPPDTAET